MGAASYVNFQRVTRPRTRKDYYLWVEQLKENKGIVESPRVSAGDQLLETLMLGLRMAEGIKLADIQAKFGQVVREKIREILTPYYLQGWVKEDSKRIYLTDPEGFLFSNTILADLFRNL
jgi:oxygen-independent coproporphyrinogen-3 oxidase